jgi:hypothetical protein
LAAGCEGVEHVPQVTGHLFRTNEYAWQYGFNSEHFATLFPSLIPEGFKSEQPLAGGPGGDGGDGGGGDGGLPLHLSQLVPAVEPVEESIHIL